MSAAGGTRSTGQMFLALAAGASFAYVLSFALLFFRHLWILDAKGKPDTEDFVAFWAAGQQVLHGVTVNAYNPRIQHAAEAAIMGHPFSGMLGFSYPPLFLFVASLLASLPYAWSFIVWVTFTCIAHAATVAAIAGRRPAFLFACGAPWSLIAAFTGQNGFLTATLIGLALLELEKRPAVSGILIGLLSYKPQLGILIPLALAAGGYWRVFLWAAATTLAANGAALLVFGPETLPAFLHALSATADSHLAKDDVSWWFKFQSVYGLVRDSGAGASAAWAAQGLLTATAIVLTMRCWQSRRVPYPLKAALLAAAALVATPYVFAYDLPVLAVALAFLWRHAGFSKNEIVLLALSLPTSVLFPWLPFPGGAVVGSLAVAALAFWRCTAYMPTGRINPSWVTDATSLPSSE